jgi:hypothetical protein
MKVSKNVVALLLLLAPKQGSSDTAALSTKILSYSNRRKLLTCPGGGSSTYSTCALCEGCKFTTRHDLDTAVAAYIVSKAIAITNYGEMNCWDVSDITDMKQLFHDKSTFNEPIGCWNVGKVTDMQNMFRYAHSFN